MTPDTRAKRTCIAAVVGTVLVAVCCFTPVLVTVLGLIGLSAWTSYLDYVLLPALLVLVVIALLAYSKWKRTTSS